MTKTLTEVHTDAVHLAGILEGLDLMLNEGGPDGDCPWGNAIVSTAVIARRFAAQITNDLDALERQK